jgi:hypothetical protein
VDQSNGAGGAGTSDQGSIPELLREARGQLNRRRYDLAVDLATQAIRLDARRSVAYLIRAEALRKLHLPDRALADLTLAIRLDPDRPAPYVIRADISMRRCLFDQAVADATQAIFLDPYNAAAFSIRATCRQAIGDPDGAAEDQEELFRIDPTRPPVFGDTASTSGAVEPHSRNSNPVRGKAPDAFHDVFADGKPVDRSLKARKPVGGDAAGALPELSDYRPEVARPLPRARSGRDHPGRSPWPFLTLITAGVAIIACVLLVNRQPSAPVPTERLLAPASAVQRAVEPIPGESGALPGWAATAGPLPDARKSAAVVAKRATTGGRPLIVGETLDGWETLTPADRPNWGLKDGILENASFGPSLVTTEKFLDFELHVEFSLPAGCNSGVFLRGRYEVSLHDPSFRDLGPERSCGAIFGSIAPDRQVYRGPDQWNYLDIKLVGKTVTVRMNGVVIIDERTLTRVSPIAIDRRESEPGAIMLQANANMEAPKDVTAGAKFRNMTIKPLPEGNASPR